MEEKNDFQVLKVRKLGEANIDTPLKSMTYKIENEFIMDHNRILIENDKIIDNKPKIFLELAGPSKKLFFDPHKIRCGIVTCGGLAPGLNNVIRGLVLTLFHRYGVRDIVGFQYGFQGCTKGSTVRILTPDVVKEIHKIGGTLLGTSRG